MAGAWLAGGWRVAGERLAGGWRAAGKRPAGGWPAAGGWLAGGWQAIGFVVRRSLIRFGFQVIDLFLFMSRNRATDAYDKCMEYAPK